MCSRHLRFAPVANVWFPRGREGQLLAPSCPGSRDCLTTREKEGELDLV